MTREKFQNDERHYLVIVMKPETFYINRFQKGPSPLVLSDLKSFKCITNDFHKILDRVNIFNRKGRSLILTMKKKLILRT